MIVGREMFLGEMIDDLPDQSKKKKILAKMARMTRMALTVARRFCRSYLVPFAYFPALGTVCILYFAYVAAIVYFSISSVSHSLYEKPK